MQSNADSDEEASKAGPCRLIGLGGFIIVFVLMALAWRYMPLSKWIKPGTLITLARSIDNEPLAPIAVILFYAIAGLLIPITLLIAVTGIVFGPVYGAAYAIIGSLSSAALTYHLGKRLGRDAVRRYMGTGINRLNCRIASRGILAMAIIRVLPVAPFTVVNVIAGVSHIGWRDYMLGTALGMSPGIILTVVFVHDLTQAMLNPSPQAFAMLAVVIAMLIVAALGMQKLFDRLGAVRNK